MKILVLDNYDSFTYNLVHMVEKIIDERADVVLNDKVNLPEVDKYDKIILSPGPGIPSEAGKMMELIKMYADKKSILGVCLGHQAIGEVFGATLVNLADVFHGLALPLDFVDENEPLLAGLHKGDEVGRYHSWALDAENFPRQLKITATDTNGLVMALRHNQYDVKGVQFHPESILTPSGENILANWING